MCGPHRLCRTESLSVSMRPAPVLFRNPVAWNFRASLSLTGPTKPSGHTLHLRCYCSAEPCQAHFRLCQTLQGAGSNQLVITDVALIAAASSHQSLPLLQTVLGGPCGTHVTAWGFHHESCQWCTIWPARCKQLMLTNLCL